MNRIVLLKASNAKCPFSLMHLIVYNSAQTVLCVCLWRAVDDCNIPSVKKKKKKERIRLFLVPTCPPPNPTPHHSISPTSLLSFGRLSLFFLSFSLYLNTHTHTHSFPHSPAGLHSKPHNLTIIFPARSPEKYLGTLKHLHHFIWGKSSNLFWWVLCSCLRLFYPCFYNDIHVI